MLNEEELQSLHTNQRLLVIEMQGRGIDIISLDGTIELLEASYNGHNEFLLDRDSSIVPYLTSVISGDKLLAKTLLRRAGINVNEGLAFTRNEINDSLLYAQELGFPVVVKPNFGSHGDNVHIDLNNLCDVKEAIDQVVWSIGNRAFLVEQQFDGNEYRVFVTREGSYAVLYRDPAHVVGNGQDTLEKLVLDENTSRNLRTNSLCPISVDSQALRFLARNDMNLHYLPEEGKKVYLRHNSNIADGGVCENYTDRVHPSVIDISRKALEVFHGLPYAGIDFMTVDVETEQTADSYRVIEVNSVQLIHMHMRHGKGSHINVDSYIVYIIFPETKQ